MAIPAINAAFRHVMFMAKRRRLLLNHAGIRHVRRADHGVRHPTKRSDDEHRAKNRDARDRVHARMKYLRHVVSRSLRPLFRTTRVATFCSKLPTCSQLRDHSIKESFPGERRRSIVSSQELDAS